MHFTYFSKIKIQHLYFFVSFPLEPFSYLDPQDFSSIPWRVSCRELMRILHLSSLAILDCLISEMAVTKVSIALANSPNGRHDCMQELCKNFLTSTVYTYTSYQPTCTSILNSSRNGTARHCFISLKNLFELLFTESWRLRLRSENQYKKGADFLSIFSIKYVAEFNIQYPIWNWRILYENLFCNITIFFGTLH